MTTHPTVDVVHDTDHQRFVVELDAGEACLEYQMDGSVLDTVWTFVPEPERGRGIASAITRRALDYADREGFQVRPTCPFVRAFIEQEPEYARLVVE